jgi:lipoprotein-anchoring transpeptidase ErfK/SrfK
VKNRFLAHLDFWRKIPGNFMTQASSPLHPAFRPIAAASLLLFLLGGCAQKDDAHRIVISIPEQRMMVLEEGRPIAQYPVSTSKFCLSDQPGSRGTPLGELEIARKIGGDAPPGAVFKDQRPTGEIVQPNSPGRDPIVSRILWLKGLEAQNRNAYGRYIYIHGTAAESQIGTPASFGCIRMRSADVIQLYATVGVGAKVDITQQTLAQATGIAEPQGALQPAVAEASPVPKAVAADQQPFASTPH